MANNTIHYQIVSRNMSPYVASGETLDEFCSRYAKRLKEEIESSYPEYAVEVEILRDGGSVEHVRISHGDTFDFEGYSRDVVEEVEEIANDLLNGLS